MAEVEEKGKRGGEGGWKEVCVCVRGGGEFGFQWASCGKKKRGKASKCAVHVGGGCGVHQVTMFWLGRLSSLPHARALLSINQP